MYINFKYATQKGLKPGQLLILQLCKQMKFEDVSEYLEKLCTADEKYLKVLEEKELVEYIKGRKGESIWKRVRLSSKGGELLEQIETPDITEDDVKMFSYLSDMYLKNDPDGKRSIGNKKLTLMYTAQFRNLVGLTIHQMYWLCMMFVQEYKFTNILELIFFVKSKNQYGKFKDNLQDSKLFQFYESRKPEVEAYWKLKIKE